MPNRIRPRHPACDSAMDPVFRKGPRGSAFVRLADTFHCDQHDIVARGREKVEYLGA